MSASSSHVGPAEVDAGRALGRPLPALLENGRRMPHNKLMGFANTTSQHDQLLRELNEERAAALTRISRRLEALIAQLQTTREQIAQERGDERARSVAAYRELHGEAVKYRWYLEVQREAMGLRYHQRLDEFYRVPPAEP